MHHSAEKDARIANLCCGHVAWAGASVCPDCKRMVKHKSHGGPHRRAA